MKARLLLYLFIITFSGIALAGESTISHIQGKYQSIQKMMPSLKTESMSLSGYSTEGGLAKAYRDNKGHMRLLKIQIFGETGKMLKEFYFENGMLIFAFYEHHQYNTPFYVTSQRAKEIGSEPFAPKKTKIIHDRYYFDKGKMVSWYHENKTEMKQDTIEFEKTEQEIIATSNEFVSKFK